MIFRVAIAGVIAGVLANVSGYFITGRWFHRFQAHTPNTWRAAESWVHYQYSALIRLACCVGIALLYAAFGSQALELAESALVRALFFGSLLWLAVAMPIILEISIFVHWHKGFVVGLLLDWFVLIQLASIAAAIGLV